MASETSAPQSNPSFSGMFYGRAAQFGPAGIAAMIGGYYGFGIICDSPVMDYLLINVRKIAVPILKRIGGYAFVGWGMPYVYQGLFWGITLACAALAGVLILIVQKICIYIWGALSKYKPAFLRPVEGNKSPGKKTSKVSWFRLQV